MFLKFVALIFSFLSCTTLHAKEVVQLAVANTRLPYIDPNNNSGVELDILKDAFRRMDCELKLIYVPSADLPKKIIDSDIQAINSVYQIKTIPLFYSNPTIYYANRAIFLKKRNLKINSIQDLSHYSVAAFANAKFYLGDSFKKAVELNKYYTEYKDQSIQAKLLISGRVDVVIADVNIFKHHLEKIKLQKIELGYAEIFTPSPYKVAFKDEKLKNRFNKALDEMRADKTFDKILETYKAKGQIFEKAF